MPRLGQRAQDVVGEVDRRRHQVLGLAAGEAEHDALVARPLVLVADGVDALGDVRRLGVDQDFDLHLLPVEPGLLVADVLDRPARRLLHHRGGDGGRPANLAGQHHPIGGGEGLDRDPRLGLGGQEGVDDRIRDAIADLVGMTFGNRFTGE